MRSGVLLSSVMSNRSKWAHWKYRRHKHEPVKAWLVGLASVSLGVVLAWAGSQGVRDQILLYRDFDFRFGQVVWSSPVRLIFIGALFVIGGFYVLISQK